MHPPPLSLDQLSALPEIYRKTIPPEYEDRNGHMNVRWYLVTYDEAGDALYPMIGLTDDYLEKSGEGGFDLEHHIWYLSEVNVGDTVSVRVRMISRSAKLFHYLMFMWNETTGKLSSIFECVHAHADLKIRKVAAFPPQVASAVDALVAGQQGLPWAAPVSGSMVVKSATGV